MVAGSTGLALLRALILDLMRLEEKPRVHLFFGARHPCELYDLPTLWQIADRSPWLSVTRSPNSRPIRGGPTTTRPDATTRPACPGNRATAGGGEWVRRLG